MEWDVFISHAWEDKESFARPLAQGLADFGLKVWFDECTLTVGDSLRRSIDQGLARSRFGIVVISRNFLQKEWPQKELDGLVAREVDGIKVILPVWHEITADEVRSYSPLLADRLAASSDKGLDHVIAELIRAIQRDSPALSATTRFIPDQTGESNGPGRAAKLNTLGTPESERAKEDGLQPTQEHVVLLIHGIRTTARWIGMIKNTLERSSTTPLIVELVYYGRFSLLRFLLPGPTRWSRGNGEAIRGGCSQAKRRSCQAFRRKAAYLGHCSQLRYLLPFPGPRQAAKHQTAPGDPLRVRAPHGIRHWALPPTIGPR
jgi:hypothetical protein